MEEQVYTVKTKKKVEEWNGRDFVVNIGSCTDGKSSWEDCRRYAIISAGGGKWYSNSLKQLELGSRVFAMIPKKGYIGVGIVERKALPASKGIHALCKWKGVINS